MGKVMKLNIDPKKVEFDGRSFRLIVEDEQEFLKKLKAKQREILEDLGLEEEEQCLPR